MWSVSPPVITVGQAVSACARGTRDRELAGRLTTARPDLELNNDRYRDAISAHRMHLIEESQYSVTGMSDKDMKWMYTRQFSRDGRPARQLYDQLMSAAPQGRCCYCQYGQAKTLDHFVPQEHLATLAIDPWNLVPACEQCNHKMLARWGTSAREQMLHPYDMPELGRWLFARVADRGPIRVEFTVIPADYHHEDTRARMENEFKVLGLADLYSVVAAGEVAIVSRTLSRLFEPNNATIVRNHLLEIASDAFGVDVNSRYGALWSALAEDDWFCEGGYGALSDE